MYDGDVLVSAPYGAAGLGLPQIIQKNANHPAAAITGLPGTSRQRAARLAVHQARNHKQAE